MLRLLDDDVQGEQLDALGHGEDGVLPAATLGASGQARPCHTRRGASALGSGRGRRRGVQEMDLGADADGSPN